MMSYSRCIFPVVLWVLSFTGLQAGDFNCEDPPFYTLGESLYVHSPSPQMEFTHILISLFSQYFVREEGREQSSAVSQYDGNRRLATFREEYINGIRTTIITPQGIRNDKKILYFHGGAYSQDILIFQWEMVLDLAIKAGSPVYVIHYGLAPEVTFPVPVDQGYAVYMGLLQSFGSDELVFMGDSAGGGLALGVAAKLRDEGRPLPAQLILISPWLDIACDNPDMLAIDEQDMMLGVESLQGSGLNYVGQDAALLDHPYASPILVEDLHEMPPCLLCTGSYDILYPDALLFRDKAEADGMDLTFVPVHGGFHVWISAPAWLIPESARARRQIASFINCHAAGGRLAHSNDSGNSGENLPSVTLYPNPGFGDFHVQIDRTLTGEDPEKWQIDIYDAKGELRDRSTHLLDHAHTDVLISTGLDAGIYKVRVSSGHFSQTLTLVTH